jgi:hypothetical protein
MAHLIPAESIVQHRARLIAYGAAQKLGRRESSECPDVTRLRTHVPRAFDRLESAPRPTRHCRLSGNHRARLRHEVVGQPPPPSAAMAWGRQVEQCAEGASETGWGQPSRIRRTQLRGRSRPNPRGLEKQPSLRHTNPIVACSTTRNGPVDCAATVPTTSCEAITEFVDSALRDGKTVVDVQAFAQ